MQVADERVRALVGGGPATAIVDHDDGMDEPV